MLPIPLKQPLTFEEQAQKLIARGLENCSQVELEVFLQGVNYYRLNAYFHSEIDLTTDRFVPGFTFDTLKARYAIDGWLRRIILLLIEPIEVKVRTMLAYWSAHNAGPEMFYDSSNFRNVEKWNEVSKSFEKIRHTPSESKDPVLNHHEVKYGGKFPVWVVVEYLSFGNTSKLLANSKTFVTGKVADSFNGLASPLVVSWIHSIAVIRNICAHYGFLFQRCFSVLPKKAYWERYSGFSQNSKLFPHLLIIKYLSEPADWVRISKILEKRIDESPDFKLDAYGFPVDWKKYL
jgi:abortive infection bacteriophage resistance protein